MKELEHVKRAVTYLDYDPEFVNYPKDLTVDASIDVLVGVVDGWVSFENNEDGGNLVQLSEFEFARVVEIWQEERRKAIPAGQWAIEFKQWAVEDGRALTDGWETLGAGVFNSLNEANLEMDRHVDRAASFAMTRCVYRVVKVEND